MNWILMVIVAGHFQLTEVVNSEEECTAQAKVYQEKMSQASTVCASAEFVLSGNE